MHVHQDAFHIRLRHHHGGAVDDAVIASHAAVGLEVTVLVYERAFHIQQRDAVNNLKQHLCFTPLVNASFGKGARINSQLLAGRHRPLCIAQLCDVQPVGQRAEKDPRIAGLQQQGCVQHPAGDLWIVH